jgi:uncharacterized protein YbaR (Trm112 family)
VSHEPEYCYQTEDTPAVVTLSPIDRKVADAVAHLRLIDHDATMLGVVRRMRALRLERSISRDVGDESMSDAAPVPQELLDILHCPVCISKVRLQDDELVCDGCGRRYRIDDGIPVMLADEAK